MAWDDLGVISLTLRELSKMFSWNLCITEIVFLRGISSWNFERVPNAVLWAHVQMFSLKFSLNMTSGTAYFHDIVLESSRNVIETTPRPPATVILTSPCVWEGEFELSVSSRCRENASLYFINTLRPRQNDDHFLGNIFTCILLNENVWITINISLKFVPKCQIKIISALVQIMAWCRTGDKPLPEPVMTWFTDTYRQISNISRTYTPNFNVSRLVLQFRCPSYWCQALSRVVGAAPRGDAPTTSEWSTILLPTKVRLILDTWRYMRH